MYRLGFTETTLLFYYYLENILNERKYYEDSRDNLINWLYSTSGFYDKKIEGNYFNFEPEKCLKSVVYNTYMNTILKIIKQYKNEIILCFHNLPNELLPYKEQFLQYVNYKPNNTYICRDVLFNFMNSKNVLIVHNMSELYKNQYENGNLKLIYMDCPNIKKICTYLPGYTYLNTGPDESILETASEHCLKIGEIIDNNDIDCVVVSCGAYSILLADYVYSTKKKEVLVSGGELPHYFGVITKRTPPPENETTHLWIPVPEHLRPQNYEKIENGCYW
jgi:hypothetical protein